MKFQYILAMASHQDALPAPIGSIVAEDFPGGVCGEAAVAQVYDAAPGMVSAAIALLRSIPLPGTASASQWLTGLAGLTNGDIRLTGPWTRDAAERDEILNTALDEVGLKVRSVFMLLSGELSSTGIQ